MYKSILVAVDGSSCANRALQELDKLAQADMKIHVVSVVEDPTMIFAGEYLPTIDLNTVRESMVQAGKDILARAHEALDQLGITGVTTHLIELSILDGKDVAKAILAAADTYKADVIVLGTHGRRGFKRLLMGSVAEEALRLATKPLLLVRDTQGGLATPESTATKDAASGVSDSGCLT